MGLHGRKRKRIVSEKGEGDSTKGSVDLQSKLKKQTPPLVKRPLVVRGIE